ncbi:MAG: porin [Chitinophagaceae bacterium]|nr:porin [Chitinophagaceae bacterium]
MKSIFIAIIASVVTKGFAQSDSIKSSFTFSGYLETYYAFDFGKPDNHSRPGFIYSHNRHNEFNLNLGFIKANYSTENTRVNLALATGTYMSANYAAEPDVLKHIYEANAGIKISKKHDLWIDAGILPSHIGFESAVGKDNWTLTRGIYAENSPYFETGAKITYTTGNGKWVISGLVLNGWQRIQRVSGNNTPAFGHQLVFKPNSEIILSSGSFIGNDKPDSTRQMRYFHNLYGIFQATEKLGITIGFDMGAEQTGKGSSSYNKWFTPVMIAKYSPHPKHHIAARVEYFGDKNGVIISTGTRNGFKTWGYSLNYDLRIRDNVLWRVEGKNLRSNDKIFTRDALVAQDNFVATTSIAITL